MSTVYLDYDQATLDRELDAASTVPDINVYFREYQTGSKRARETLTGRFDIPYGPSDAETLDVFPAARPGAPTLVFFHGGYWRRLHKDDFSFVGLGFVPHGVSVVIVNYALAPLVTLGEIVRQCAAATDWVAEHVHEWGGASDDLFVGGHSAGGQLAGMVGARGGVRGITSISGLHDLEPIVLSNINETLRLPRAHVAQFSPMLHLPPSEIPLLAAVGGDESNEFRRQAAVYAEVWEARGYPAVYLELAGENHYTIVLALAEPESAMTRAVIAQIEKSRGLG